MNETNLHIDVYMLFARREVRIGNVAKYKYSCRDDKNRKKEEGAVNFA